ncbi:hypothetical protein [Brevibacillus sp. Leaf182]|uniref:hypothetical protein n=1 Tax=Brevibacillus sp. Leaf182 TaxID=1736290 RepID=UPI0006FDC8C0|nr:hypothetical protein [Brevibacillus sp. Leaf182]RAT98387.1 hypothetical protein ASG16_006740 [Brevibacillus sp. Leaf182]
MSENLTKFFNFFDGYSEMIGKHEEFKKGLFSSFTSLAETALGTSLSSVAQEAQATEREKTLFEVGGKNNDQIIKIEDTSTTIMELNPNIKKDQSYALIAKADLVHATNGLKYAEKAGMLKYTTRLTEDEAMKMMGSMEFSTGHESTVRTSNAVQYMSNKGGGAITAKFVESMGNFNFMNGKLLNTPEKMATTFVSMGKLLNDFKTYGALQENAMKMAESGDLAKILEKHYTAQGKKDAKTRADDEIKRLYRDIASGEKETINIALAKLMTTFASIKDETTQRDAFAGLTGNAGDELSKGLKEVRDKATGVFEPEYEKQEEYKVGNEAVNAHKLSTQKDAYFEPTQAQAMARNEAIGIMTEYTEKMSWLNTGISNAATGLMSGFNALEDWQKSTAIFATAFLLFNDDLINNITSRYKQFRNIFKSAKEFEKGGSDSTSKTETTSEASSRTTKDAGGKDGCCCCCCEANNSLQGTPKKFSSGKTLGPDTGKPRSGDKKNPVKRLWDRLNETFNNKFKDKSLKDFIRDKFKGGLVKKFEGMNLNKLKDGLMNKLEGFHPGKLKDKLMEQFKKLPIDKMKTGMKKFEGMNLNKLKDGLMNKLEDFHSGKLKDKLMEQFKKLPIDKMKAGMKKVPKLGIIESLAEVFSSENKLDAAARLGAESLGGWAGARLGATVGLAAGSLVTPGVGTAVGGVVGGVGGNIGGSMAGGALYDWIKSWWQDKPAEQPVSTQPSTTPAGPPIPNRSPVGNSPAIQQATSVNIPQITVPLHVEGVLQDIPTMMKMLTDPSVAQRIKDIIERSLLDALETRGGVTT